MTCYIPGPCYRKTQGMKPCKDDCECLTLAKNLTWLEYKVGALKREKHDASGR